MADEKKIDIVIPPEVFYDAVEAQENAILDWANHPGVRAMFGEELCDGVAKLSEESLEKVDQARAKLKDD
jgi:hypothetical protein